MALRKIMEQREVDIIRRLKKVLNMTVADIARVGGSNRGIRRRCQRLYAARGGHFEEGGRGS